MKIKVLGCSGGIGGDLRTTSFLVDDDILLDAGTGVGDLCMDELLAIDHVFVTHSHLDHVAYLPFLVDTVMGTRTEPLTVHATQETWSTLKNHLFNWNIWPDFNVIPNARAPFLRYNEIRIGEPVRLNGRTITALPAEHVVSAIGFWLDSGTASLVFSGDTTRCDAFWRAVNSIGKDLEAQGLKDVKASVGFDVNTQMNTLTIQTVSVVEDTGDITKTLLKYTGEHLDF